jgi:hypothetical protein
MSNQDPPNSGVIGHSRQDDTILWVSLTRLAPRDDHKAVQADDRNQSTRQEEV